MIYALFCLIAVFSTALVLFFGAQKGVIDIGRFGIYKKCDGIEPFEGKVLILLTIICAALAVAVQISLYRNTAVISFVKLYGLFILVLCASVIDFKRKIIPNFLIVLGLVFRVLIYIYEAVFLSSELKSVFINDLIGFAIGFVLLAVVSLVSKGAIGFGDAKLFGVIGLISGSFCTYSTLLISLIASACVSLIRIARKKMGRKDSMPFGPFIAVGYIAAIFLTSY